MNLFERLGFNAPQASATAQPIGQDEFGRTIYRDSTGATYAMGSQPVQRTDAQRNDQALIDAGIFPPDPADPRAAVNALATGLMSGFTAPGNALRGQPVTLGDVWGTAGTAALGGNAMPAPQNSLRALNLRQGQSLEDAAREAFPDVKLSISGSPDRGYVLSRIEVPKGQRNSGLGSEVMREIVDTADQQGATVALSPAGDFGGSVSRLREFYKRFGFVPNKGRNADYSISESMYRLPKGNQQ